MKRVLTLIAMTALAAGMLAGGAVAKKNGTPSAKKLASQQCKEEKQELGNKTFKELHGNKRAMRSCKRENLGEEQEQIRNASQECRAERDEDEAAFTETYGTNPNGRNAFGKCVSGKVKAEDEAEVEATENAAKTCKSERRDDEDEFTEKYGTNKNGRNAFGKCVSQHSDEELDEE